MITDRHALKFQMRTGIVGSTFDGSIGRFSDVGTASTFAGGNVPNTFAYHSLGVLYIWYLLIDSDRLSFTIGGSYQQNNLADVLIVVPGIIESNYNLEAGIGFEHFLNSFLVFAP